MSGNRWRIVALVMGFAAIGHFNRIGISVAGDEMFIPKLGIGETQMGWVYTTFLIVYTIGMLPGGWLIDRIGSARALTLFGLTMGTFVILTGVLGWIGTSPKIFLICLLVIRGLAGLCNAPLHPGAAHVVSDEMSVDRRATANGMITAGALIGIACCYPAFGWLMDTLTWQWAFVVSGSILIAYALLWRLFASPLLPHPRSTPSATQENVDSPSVWSLLKHRNLLLLTLSYAAYGYFQYLFFYWMGYYFKDVLNVPAVEARWASFWIMLAMGAGMAIGGRWTDVMCGWLGTNHGRRTIVITGMGLGAVFGLIGVNVTGLVNVSVCLAISMAATGMCEGVFWTTATDIGGESRGLSGAFMNTGGNVGGLISPVLTPIIADKLGWPGAIATACIISGVGGFVWLLIKLPDTTPDTFSDLPDTRYHSTHSTDGDAPEPGRTES
ncbi:MAG: MFS transporter [Planctomyces sp.]|nr:MFS transporter [Planctomyces sp.]MDP7278145.1 MFS transporter [Planctomycetaceae bacterium]